MVQVTEGKATVIVGRSEGDDEAFYNPAQVFNRDLSILCIRAFAEVFNNNSKVNVLEPLAATGLRSIRYALELENVLETVVAGDLDRAAVQIIIENRQRNNISHEKLKAVHCEANALMFASRYGGRGAVEAFSLPGSDSTAETPLASGGDAETPVTASPPASRPFIELRIPRMPGPTPDLFEVIDLDPYGSVAGFLDAAINSIADGGLLCLTSTDMTILCGNSPEVSFYKYGGSAVKARYAHEMSLRLLVHAASVTAAKHRKYVQPLLCVSVDFYIRCFLRVRTAALHCKRLAAHTAMALQCCRCDAFRCVSFGGVDVNSGLSDRQKRRKLAKASTKGTTAKKETEETIPKEETTPKGSEENLLETPAAEESTTARTELSTKDSQDSVNTGVQSEDEARNQPSHAVPVEPLKYPFQALKNVVPDANTVRFKVPHMPLDFFEDNRCRECGNAGIWIAGPFFAGSLYNKEFVDCCLNLIETEANSSLTGLTMTSKIKGVLTAIKEEIWDIPLYYNIPTLVNRIKVEMIKPAKFKSALLNMGYRVSTFHRDPQSLKVSTSRSVRRACRRGEYLDNSKIDVFLQTDAPANVVYAVLRAWAAKNPPRNRASCPILNCPSATQLEVDFKWHPAAANASEIPKWLPNPTPYWGPKARAKRSRGKGDEPVKEQ